MHALRRVPHAHLVSLPVRCLHNPNLGRREVHAGVLAPDARQGSLVMRDRPPAVAARRRGTEEP